ncbi:hypothetical protein Q5X52_01465 [Acinetobacter baumannii]|nr:hypothetical protein [Acinetobacter baumannii]
MTDLNKERELYMAAKARIEKEEFFCRDWDLWKACAELKQAEINELRAELEKAKAQAVPDTHFVVPRSREVVVAIEKMVEQQVEASGITSDVFRLDGWRILDAIQEASESGAEG